MARTCPARATYTDGVGRGSATASPARPARSSASTRTARPSTRPRPRRSQGETEQRCDSIPQLPRADLREPARHPGPRGPRHAGDQRLQRAAQHHPQPGARAVVVPAPADGPDLGHLRPGQAEAEGGLVPAGRSARGQGRAPGGAAGGDGDHGHQPARAQGRVRADDAGRRDLLHARTSPPTKPEWREVFDLTTSNKIADPTSNPYGGGSNGGWIQTSLDDKYLYHAVDGPAAPAATTRARRRTSSSWTSRSCSPPATTRSATSTRSRRPSTAVPRATARRSSTPCPAPGGPHWGALDNLELGDDGYYHETTNVKRLAYSNYFVARTGLNGDHRRLPGRRQDDDGTLTLDEEFQDESTGETCLDFDRDDAGRTATGVRRSRTRCCSSPPMTTSSSGTSTRDGSRAGRGVAVALAVAGREVGRRVRRHAGPPTAGHPGRRCAADWQAAIGGHAGARRDPSAGRAERAAAAARRRRRSR